MRRLHRKPWDDGEILPEPDRSPAYRRKPRNLPKRRSRIVGYSNGFGLFRVDVEKGIRCFRRALAWQSRLMRIYAILLDDRSWDRYWPDGRFDYRGAARNLEASRIRRTGRLVALAQGEAR